MNTVVKFNWFRNLTILFLIIALSSISDNHASCRQIKTTRKNLNNKKTSTLIYSPKPLPNLSDDNLTVKFYGYEKTVAANKETIFIQNHNKQTINRLYFTITYLDVLGNEIHSRQIKTDISIPPGKVRRFDFTSWDPQKSYYFKQSTKPRKTATPYDISINLDSVFTFDKCIR